MNAENYTASFLFDKSPEEVYNAVKNVRGWWSETVTGGTENPGDEFEYRHKTFHYSTQKLVEVVPNKKIVWLITDSDLTFVEKRDEWTGTEVNFEITEQGDKTQLVFTHAGLAPVKECFNACSDGWDYYLGSLENLIVTGQGQPDLKED